MKLYLVKYFEKQDVEFERDLYRYVVATDVERVSAQFQSVEISAIQLVSSNPLIVNVDRLH